MNFNMNPKTLVHERAKSLWRVSHFDVRVSGQRTGADYVVQCSVSGVVKASATDKNWRKAYKLLAEKLKSVRNDELQCTEPTTGGRVEA